MELFILAFVYNAFILFIFILMYSIDKETFNQNLLLTKVYCELQLADNADTRVAKVLRNFNPTYSGKPLFTYQGYGKYLKVKWSGDPLYSDDDLYDKYFEDQLTHKQQNVIITDENKVYAGKILVAELEQVIRDGVSEEETDGFIDYNDCPPIDTWFYMIKHKGNRILFAWIPERFVDVVNGGIEVNALDIFGWYDGASARLYYSGFNTL